MTFFRAWIYFYTHFVVFEKNQKKKKKKKKKQLVTGMSRNWQIRGTDGVMVIVEEKDICELSSNFISKLFVFHFMLIIHREKHEPIAYLLVLQT